MKRILSCLLLGVILFSGMNSSVPGEAASNRNIIKKQQFESAKQKEFEIIPRATKVKSIRFDQLKKALRVSEPQQIKVTVDWIGNAPKRNNLKMYSKNNNIAEIIDKGSEKGFWIEAYKTGKVTIVAECLGKSASMKINITDYAPTSVSLDNTKLTLEEGKTYTLKGIVLPKKANQNLKWTSNNNSVAVVSSSGIVTGMAAGSATITAKTDNNLETKCAVTVTKKAKQKIIQIAAGGFHSLVLLSNGDLYAWGNDYYGQIGGEQNIDKTKPVFVGTGYTQIAAGYTHTLALKGSSLYAWGNNEYGQLGDGTKKHKNVPTFIGNGFTQIAAGDHFSLALKGNSLYAWGDNKDGQLGDGTNADKNTPAFIGTGYSKVSTGYWHSLALNGNSLYTWGFNGQGQLGNGRYSSYRNIPVFIGTGFTQIAAGSCHSLALKESSLYAWGWNKYGQLGDVTSTYINTHVFIGTGFTKIAAGCDHSLALKGNSLYAWGRNDHGQLGDGTYINKTTPVFIGTGFTQIATGDRHSLALKGSSLYIWGDNDYGQLGDGKNIDRNVPTCLTFFD